MARLLSYKKKDVNRYSTFSNVSFATSTDSLMFKTMPKAKTSANISPSVHKASQKGSTDMANEIVKPKKRTRWITCCWNCKWVRKFLLHSWYMSCCHCCCCCCGTQPKKKLENDDDVDRVVEEFKTSQKGISDCQNKGTVSNAGDWRWDESWKSNSDKFLESLELEGVGSDKSLKRAADKLKSKNSRVRRPTFIISRSGGCLTRTLRFLKIKSF